MQKGTTSETPVDEPGARRESGCSSAMSFIDLVKDALRLAAAKAERKSEDERIEQAFYNGVYFGALIGMGAMAMGWITQGWLWSLAR
jgi:hypothetical protein